MDFSILFSVFDDILKCPECGNDMNSHADMKKKHCYSQYIVLQCKECDWKYYFNSSKKQRRQSFEINVRAVLAFREIGIEDIMPRPISARL